jgi:hypothetical protein
MNQNILLPKLAIPNRYEISLDVDLKNFKYLGKEIVFIEVVEDTDEIHLHSVGLTINSSFIEDDNGAHIDGSVNYLNEDEKIIINFEEKVTSGDWKLYIDFEGEIVDDLRGFYSLNEAISLLQKIKEKNQSLYMNISEMALNSDKEFVLVLVDFPTKINLGSNDLDKKIQIIESFDSSINPDGLYAFKSIDLRYQNQIITQGKR